MSSFIQNFARSDAVQQMPFLPNTPLLVAENAGYGNFFAKSTVAPEKTPVYFDSNGASVTAQVFNGSASSLVGVVTSNIALNSSNVVIKAKAFSSNMATITGSTIIPQSVVTASGSLQGGTFNIDGSNAGSPIIEGQGIIASIRFNSADYASLVGLTAYVTITAANYGSSTMSGLFVIPVMTNYNRASVVSGFDLRWGAGGALPVYSLMPFNYSIVWTQSP